ncbi:hypothetical protein ABVT39_013427 [Epinephelus coioides]
MEPVDQGSDALHQALTGQGTLLRQHTPSPPAIHLRPVSPMCNLGTCRDFLMQCAGTSSVTQFAIQFRCLATESSWKEDALQGAFQNGINENIKDELVSHPEPEGMDDLIALAIRIDNHIRERRREKTVSNLPALLCSLAPLCSTCPHLGRSSLLLTQPAPTSDTPACSPLNLPPPRTLWAHTPSPFPSSPPDSAHHPES